MVLVTGSGVTAIVMDTPGCAGEHHLPAKQPTFVYAFDPLLAHSNT
jgi:hypothetical protein